ncbi:MAG: MgtC/SapB family protein [Bryobacteraceae bacterium]
MPLHPSWPDLALRLLLTVVAGALIGFNRGEHGKSAGLRTNLLVCLAASIAMIQVNLLLGTRGRTWDSFMMADPMRLPLGILSGVGFIGGGAILQRRNLVVGVTTAATLWFATVMGLCFGGGQILLGLAALVLGMAVLWGLKLIEERWKEQRRAVLVVGCEAQSAANEEIVRQLRAAGLKVALESVLYGNEMELRFALSWRARRTETEPPAVLREIANLPSVQRVQWKT